MTPSRPDGPFSGIFPYGDNSVPVLADLDDDGDLDLLFVVDYEPLYYENIGTLTAPAFTRRGYPQNPFAGYDIRYPITFVDLDGDGDPDVVEGGNVLAGIGGFDYIENEGTATAPLYREVSYSEDPLSGLDTDQASSPAFADLDGDGDFDLVSGNRNSTFEYFENTGSATSPAFVEREGAANPLDGLRNHPSEGARTTPALGDLDGDGDLDLISGHDHGQLHYYENTGTATSPAFTERAGAANPLPEDLEDTSNQTRPFLADLDEDGDLDLLVGRIFDPGVPLAYYENTGTASSPTFTARTGEANPFVGYDGPSLHAPTAVDLDGDGDLDVVSQVSGDRVVVLAQDDFMTVDAEDGPLAGGLALGAAYPNPAAVQTRIEFTVEAPQRVRAVLYDVLGRRVAALFEGEVRPGTPVALAVEVGGLPAGTYFVRVEAERFSATRRITVVH